MQDGGGGELGQKQKNEKIGSGRIVGEGIRVPESWQDREVDVGVSYFWCEAVLADEGLERSRVEVKVTTL